MATGTRKKAAPQYTPVDPDPGAKPFISHELQARFVNEFLGKLPEEQLKGAKAVLDAITDTYGVKEGYRRFFHWWRKVRADLGEIVQF